MYICIQKNIAQTPINKGFFHVSQIGIYRYTDEKLVQKKGKGEKVTEKPGENGTKKRPPHSYLECRWPLAKRLER